MLVLVVLFAEPYEIVVRPTTKYVGCMCTYNPMDPSSSPQIPHSCCPGDYWISRRQTTWPPWSRPSDHLRYQLCPIRANEYLPSRILLFLSICQVRSQKVFLRSFEVRWANDFAFLLTFILDFLARLIHFSK